MDSPSSPSPCPLHGWDPLPGFPPPRPPAGRPPPPPPGPPPPWDWDVNPYEDDEEEEDEEEEDEDGCASMFLLWLLPFSGSPFCSFSGPSESH